MIDTLRSLISQVAPGVEETIAYGLLGYPGLASLAAQKGYVALYLDPEVVSRFDGLLVQVDHGRSCLRFRRSEQIPVDAVRAMLVARLDKSRGAMA